MATAPPATTTPPSRSRSLPVAARVAGGALLLATASIHLDLYLTGYRQIPTIGWMFLLQVVVGFALGLAVLAIGGSTRMGRLAAGSGALFALATLGGYLLSMWVGLFGFKEIRTTIGIVAAMVEIAAFMILGTLAGWRMQARGRWIALPLSAVAAVVLVVSEVNATGAVVVTPRHPSTAVPGATSKGTVLIVIKNFAFRPADTTVKPGERIIVKNEDSVTHTFTATGPAAGKFNSGPIVPGQSRSVVAPVASGNYPYFCTIHQFMTGVLTVSGSTSS